MTNNFKSSEFVCPCCGRSDIQPQLIERLQNARSIAGIAFKITSGWRCEAHNKEVGGEIGSSHLKGWAADIACPTSAIYFKILSAVIHAGFNRIGRGRDYIHVDCDPAKPTHVSWPYPSHSA